MKKISPFWLVPAVVAGLGLSRIVSKLESLVQKQPVPVIPTSLEDSAEPEIPAEKGEIYAVIATGYANGGSYQDTIETALASYEIVQKKGAKPENIRLFIDNPQKIPIPERINSKKPSNEKVLKAIENIPINGNDDLYLILSSDMYGGKGILFLGDDGNNNGPSLGDEELNLTLSKKKYGRLFAMIRNEFANTYSTLLRYKLQGAKKGNMFYHFADKASFKEFLEYFSDNNSLLSFRQTKDRYNKTANIYFTPSAYFIASNGETFDDSADGWINRFDQPVQEIRLIEEFVQEKDLSQPVQKEKSNYPKDSYEKLTYALE